MPFGPVKVNEILGLTVLGSPVTANTPCYLALCSSIGSGGLSVAEIPSGLGYGRQAVIFGTPSNRGVTNTNSFAFSPANTVWPAIPHIAIYTHVSSGDLIAYGTLVNTKTVLTSVVASVSVGSITYRLN